MNIVSSNEMIDLRFFFSLFFFGGVRVCVCGKESERERKKEKEKEKVWASE